MKEFNLEGYSVQTDSDEQSRELQEMAFEQGFSWRREGKLNKSSRFFMFRDKSITWKEFHAADLKQIHFNDIKKYLLMKSDCDSESQTYSEGGKWELEEFALKDGLWVKTEKETLKEKLAKAEAEVERLKKEIEEQKIPKAGEWCKFWDGDKDTFIMSKLKEIDNSSLPYRCATGVWYKNCEKITNKELIKLLENEK